MKPLVPRCETKSFKRLNQISFLRNRFFSYKQAISMQLVLIIKMPKNYIHMCCRWQIFFIFISRFILL